MRQELFQVVVVPAGAIRAFATTQCRNPDVELLWWLRPSMVFTAQDDKAIDLGRSLVELVGGGVPVIPKQSLDNVGDATTPGKEFICMLERLARRGDVDLVFVVTEDDQRHAAHEMLNKRLPELEFTVFVLESNGGPVWMSLGDNYEESYCE